MVSTFEQMQVPNGTGPGVRRSKRPLLASRTRCNVLWNFVNSLPNHFKFSTVVVEKRNFRSHRYDVINIFKLAYLRYLLSD